MEQLAINQPESQGMSSGMMMGMNDSRQQEDWDNQGGMMMDLNQQNNNRQGTASSGGGGFGYNQPDLM